jgi:uncharacterized protein (DUF1499 family)
MGIALALAVIAFLGLVVAVRLVPSDPAVWDVDVATVDKPGRPNNWLVRDDGGDAPALILPLPPEAAMARVMAVAAATPRTEVLARGPARATFVTRSALMSWPDYTTVAVDPVPGGSRVTLFARSRFGYGDMGVNRARAEAWLADLAAP